MKFLSLILLFLTLKWSWAMVYHPSAIDQDTHLAVQEDFKRIVTNYIVEKLPSAKSLKFEKMWSETLNDNRIKASFIYSFEDVTEEIETARVQIQGYAIINRLRESSTEPVETWSFDQLFILDEKIEFKEGLHIQSSPNSNQ